MPTHADIEEMKYSYGNRVGWRRRAVEDFGDGGAFPEIPVAQYPLNMGRKASSSSIALAVQVNSEGQVDYIAIARQGTDDKQVIHAAFEDLIPLRQRVAVGDISLGRPSEDEVKAQTEKTKTALMWRVSGPAQGQNPRSRKPNADNRSANYVRYTLADQRKNGRIAKVVEKAKDPVDPPRHRIRKGCQDNASPPAPIMHSPPRRLTAADREAWNIPHLVSNRKNPRGYTIPLDKRLAAAGLGLHDAQISDKFAYNAEAFFTAERHMREKIKERAQSQQKLEEREGTERETSAYAAERARQERQRSQPRDRNARIDSNTETEPAPSAFGSKDEDDEALRDPRQAQRERHRENDKAIREREQARRERFKENARHLRQYPTQTSETRYESRLFNQTSGFGTGFNEDRAYDKPLFAAQHTINSIYRPQVKGHDGADEEDTGGSDLDRLRKAPRLEYLGKAAKEFSGVAEAEARDGPVQFEKVDMSDPFNIGEMLEEARGDGRGGKEGSDGAKRVRRAGAGGPSIGKT